MLRDEIQADASTFSAVKQPLLLSSELIDRLILARLSLNRLQESAMDEDEPDLDTMTALAALPANETTFEYLSGCWKRERQERFSVLSSGGNSGNEQEKKKRLEVLDNVKGLVVSYMGLVLADPEMFPQDHVTLVPFFFSRFFPDLTLYARAKHLGTLELLPLLLPSISPPATFQLKPPDLPLLLTDLSSSPSIEEGLSPFIAPLILHSSRALITNKLDLGTIGDGGWRDHLNSVLGLSEIKPAAAGMVECANWDPVEKGGAHGVSPPAMEIVSLLGPFLRLSTFPDAFVSS